MSKDDRTTQKGPQPPPVPGSKRPKRRMRTTDEWNSAIVSANATAEYPIMEDDTSPSAYLAGPADLRFEADLETPTLTGWIRPPGAALTTHKDEQRKRAVTSMHQTVSGETKDTETITAEPMNTTSSGTSSHKVAWIIENLRARGLEFSDVWVPRASEGPRIDDGSFAAALDSLATLANQAWNDSRDGFASVAFRLSSRQMICWLRDGDLGAALLIIPVAVESNLLQLIQEARNKASDSND